MTTYPYLVIDGKDTVLVEEIADTLLVTREVGHKKRWLTVVDGEREKRTGGIWPSSSAIINKMGGVNKLPHL